MFGTPGQGVHSIRFFGIAVVDVLFTILAAVVFDYWIEGQNTVRGVLKMCAALFLLGIFAHRLFCVNTAVNKAIFGVIH